MDPDVTSLLDGVRNPVGGLVKASVECLPFTLTTKSTKN